MKSQQNQNDYSINNSPFHSPAIQASIEYLILSVTNFADEDFDVKKANLDESELDILIAQLINYWCEYNLNGKVLGGLVNGMRHGDEE